MKKIVILMLVITSFNLIFSFKKEDLDKLIKGNKDCQECDLSGLVIINNIPRMPGPLLLGRTPEAILKAEGIEGMNFTKANLSYARIYAQGKESISYPPKALKVYSPSLEERKKQLKERLGKFEFFKNLEFEKANLKFAEIYIKNLEKPNFKGANLSGATLVSTVSLNANFENANLNGAVLGVQIRGVENSAIFRGANFKKAVLTNANLLGVDLTDADLADADLSGANLKEIVVSSGTKFSKASLENIVIDYKTAEEIKKAKIALSDKQKNEIEKALEMAKTIEEKGDFNFLRENKKLPFFSFIQFFSFKKNNLENLKNAQMQGSDFESADLSDVNLEGAYLVGANFTGANLTNANLLFANLSVARLVGANLTGANLIAADLIDADLAKTDLTNANLEEVDFKNANLTGADLTGADLTGANLAGADLTGANLTNTIFNETIIIENMKEYDWYKNLTNDQKKGFKTIEEIEKEVKAESVELEKKKMGEKAAAAEVTQKVFREYEFKFKKAKAAAERAKAKTEEKVPEIPTVPSVIAEPIVPTAAQAAAQKRALEEQAKLGAEKARVAEEAPAKVTAVQVEAKTPAKSITEEVEVKAAPVRPEPPAPTGPEIRLAPPTSRPTGPAIRPATPAKKGKKRKRKPTRRKKGKARKGKKARRKKRA